MLIVAVALADDDDVADDVADRPDVDDDDGVALLVAELLPVLELVADVLNV